MLFYYLQETLTILLFIFIISFVHVNVYFNHDILFLQRINIIASVENMIQFYFMQ